MKDRMMRKALAPCAVAAAIAAAPLAATDGGNAGEAPPVETPYPIMFVTQVPVPADFTTIGSTFGNHSGQPNRCARGGDLYIRYTDGTLRNLTEEAGYGNAGFQGQGSISVREPCVHWSGAKALFSMVIGAPTQQYVWGSYDWQMYEVTGFGPGETVTITKVPNQPEGVNNVSPIYASDDSVIFTSDRPIGGMTHLFPQLDEYESAAVVTGLWRLDPSSGDVTMLMPAPSGAFAPMIDEHGRVLFTLWDHLQRDQQTDAYWMNGDGTGSFNYQSEAPDAISAGHNEEVFPEPRGSWINYVESQPDYDGPLRGYEPHLEGHTIERFQPWQVNQDGSDLEILNHAGRHELATYFNRSFNDDPNLVEFIAGGDGNPNRIRGFFQPADDPNDGNLLYGIDAPTFGTHACGQLVRIDSGPDANPDAMVVTCVTHPDTANADDTPSPDHSGLYRNPVVLDDGRVVASHTPETRSDANEGSTALPQSRYDLRLKTIVPAGDYSVGAEPLTAGIVKTISYWNPDTLVSYSDELWELDPVEVRTRSVPPTHTTELPAIERQVLIEERIDAQALRAVLEKNGLALVVSRNVTTRDGSDRQQPFNLKVEHSDTQTIGASGAVYDVAHLQIVQGDLIRGYDNKEGRRTIAQVMHEPSALALNPPATGPAGSTRLGDDGSMAALVPARRALSWQLTDDAGNAVVRERYWLSFQPGEMRSCTSCHGINTADQALAPEPTNPPEALRALMDHLVESGALARRDAADVNLDGTVDVQDLVIVISEWGPCPDPVIEACPADLDHDGTVGVGDLVMVVTGWS